MKKLLVFLFSLCTIVGLSAQTSSQTSTCLGEIKFVTDDIDNFYNMLSLLSEAQNSSDSIHIIKESYLDIASAGLQEYLSGEIQNGRNVPNEYLKVINAYPEYFNSQKASMLGLGGRLSDYIPYFGKIQEIYPDAHFYPNYLSIGFFNTQGQMLGSRSVFVSLEATLTGEEVDYTEFSGDWHWLKEDGATVEELAHLLVHENLHSQQQTGHLDKSLLNAAVIEGAAVFLTEYIAGKESLIGLAGLSEEMFEAAEKEGKGIWEAFTKDVGNNESSEWFFNDAGKYPFAMGYFMGYMICRDFFEVSKDKKEALSILIEVSNPEFIYKNSSYYTSP